MLPPPLSLEARESVISILCLFSSSKIKSDILFLENIKGYWSSAFIHKIHFSTSEDFVGSASLK